MEISNLFSFVYTVLGNYYVVLTSKAISFFVFFSLAIFLLSRKKSSEVCNKLILTATVIITGILVENMAWIIKLSSTLNILPLPHPIIKISIATAWALYILVYQGFGILVENLAQNKFKISLHQKIFTLLSIMFSSYTLIQALQNYNVPTQSLFSFPLMKLLPIYQILTVLPSVALGIKNLKNPHLPKLLKEQLKILLYYLVIPYFTFEIIEIIPVSHWLTSITSQIHFTPITSILALAALLYFTKKIIRLRFLNLSNHVLAAPNKPLPSNTKEYVWKLSNARSVNEARLIAQGFFKERFNIKEHNIVVHTRTTKDHCAHNTIFCKNCEEQVEQFIARNTSHTRLLKEKGILTKDELEFDAFYDLYPEAKTLHTFMQHIYADLFIPLFESDILIGYVGILQQEHKHFYTESDVDQIAIFGNYLCVVLNVLHKKDIEKLRLENKTLKEEVFEKHQHINEYKESLKYLVRKNTSKDFGILQWKEPHFTYLNEEAQTLLGLNINQQKEHPLSKKLHTFAKKIQSYRMTKTIHCHNSEGKELIVTGMIQLQSNSVLLHINQPDALQRVLRHIDVLHDPSTWDYSLYLETTQSGKLINTLLPSNCDAFFNFKIKLLQVALSKKAIALHSNPVDAQHVANIIHQISLRDTMQIIELSPTDSSHDIATMLFGANAILYPKHPEALLKQMDKRGTLYIKNLEYLSTRVQKDLAQFITYGTYTPLHTETIKVADVRVICTTQSDLKVLLEQGSLTPELYDALQATSLSLPNFAHLHKKDFESLVESFAQHRLQQEHPGSYIYLSQQEKELLLSQQFQSFDELDKAIQQVIQEKKQSKPLEANHIIRVTQHLTDANENPELLQAAQLGKECLQNEDMMRKLWNHFKNQAQIAAFLGVNRSSVNRRCKKYNLIT